MKKYILLVGLVMLTVSSFSQQYNNEWIDYTKTYYRLKVGATGLHRITGATLAAMNLGTTPAEHFQLWRNGSQVPIYTSNPSGPLPANGYIEFWGEKNDGRFERELYRDPSYQLNNQVSLLSDTAAYFLTVAATAANLRFTEAANNISPGATPEPYFMHTARHNFMEQIHRGLALPAGSEYVYSSAYDIGEMWTSRDINPGWPHSIPFNNLYAAPGGPSAIMRAAMAGSAPNNRAYRIELNNVPIIDSTLSTFSAGTNVRTNVALTGNNAVIGIINRSPVGHDRIVCSYVEITYPRQFNFDNQITFRFSLPASAGARYLEIANFNHGNVTPRLYDLTNRRFYTGELSPTGVVKLMVPASSTALDLVLVNPWAFSEVPALVQRTFTDYRLPANQGDYLIISHQLIRQAFAGQDQVEAYRAYRASNSGGSFVARIADIDELVDQFAFGVKKSPFSVKNFLRFARSHFATAPKYAFLIGKGVSYNEYRLRQASPHADRLNLVPTWGYPASDIMLASDNLDPNMRTGIGRISVVSGSELSDYLLKVKQFEAAQQNPAQTIDAKSWMKNVVHVEGANDPQISNLLAGYMRNYEQLIKDTLYGANVVTFNKQTTGPVTPITNQMMQRMFETGISLLNYFGHSSATALDYNLEDPYSYNNQGKYPFFIVNGCNAGNMFSFDTSRFSVLSTLTERFVLAKERGAIGFVASTHFGLTSYLDYYNQGFYKSLKGPGYNKSISENMLAANTALLTSPYGAHVMGARLHAEETTLHGDPALKINAHAKPDFVVEEPQIRIVPNIVSVSDLKFDVKAYLWNIGKATGDSLLVQVRRQYPDGTSETVFQKKIKSIRYLDSVILQLPIDPIRDRGENKIFVTVDGDNAYDELSETNNGGFRTFVIQDNGVRPVYPANFAIVSKTNIKLAASTSNPMAKEQQYTMELDTTELFNSPLKITRTISSRGGVLEFDPGVTFTDSTVYYWRVGVVPPAGATLWATSSFTYLPGSQSGYDQSHFFQHQKSTTSRMSMDSATRRWKYGMTATNINIINSVFAVSGFYNNDFSIAVNGTTNIYSACLGHSVIFNVFDPVTMKPYFNQPQPGIVRSSVPLGKFMGSDTVCSPGREYNFEFSYMNAEGRRKMRDFMDWIPAGAVVTARLILDAPFDQTPLIDTWKADEALHGTGNTLYHRLKAAGFAELDSFTRPRTWAFAYKKNDPSFTPVSRMSVIMEMITMSVNVPTPDTLGFVTSPAFGPARAWKQVKWRGATQETAPGDSLRIFVLGVRPTGVEDTLYRLNATQRELDISGVSAIQYPQLKLYMRTEDGKNLTPYQLRYWRIHFEPLPEGSLAPNLSPAIKDSFDVGETMEVAIPFKNISDTTFSDSIRVRVVMYDKSNTATVIPYARLKALAPGDTAVIRLTFDTKLLSGNNTLYIDVNPNLEIPEQFRFNNFLYKNFTVINDVYNPLLDVTFDGLRILNGDIVSARPKIMVKLVDDAKFMALDDTALLTVYLKYPDGTMRRFAYGTDTLRFIPADITTGKNEATLEFSPSLVEDATGHQFYELIVKAKDRSGNPTSHVDYSVRFQVVNKPMISNVFNYPNPFTSSTAFVFTITGSEVPQNVRIQIMTVTGKIVKEITKQELGPLNIGRNITEYKWDGTDQYGQQLGNGIYLYRVITNHNGTSLEKYQVNDASGSRVNTDQYFEKGYGKMYLMR